jgi:hypothetical protein
MFQWPCIMISFVYNNQLDASNIQNLFCHKILRVSGIFCAHHQGYLLYTRQLVRFMQVMWPLHSRVRLEQPDSARKRSQLAWNIPIATYTADNSWWGAEKMPETCRVSWQNKILDTWCI